MPSLLVPALNTLPGTAGVFGHLLGSEKVNSSLKLRKRTDWVSLTQRSLWLNSILLPQYYSLSKAQYHHNQLSL